MILLQLILYGFLVYNIGRIFVDISERREIKAKKDPLYHYYP